MINRFQFDKWTNNGIAHSNKSICPNCGKKTFVRIVDSYTGKYLPEYVGKCDRANKCGYYYGVKQYFQDSPEAKKTYYNKTVGNEMRIKLKPDGNTKVGTIERTLLESSLKETSNFKEFLLDRFSGKIDDVINVCSQYNIGGDGKGGVIFWQIDEHGQPRTGKIMQYDRYNGHRIKNGNSVNWIHSKLRKEGKLSADWKLGQVLFGSHLISSDTEKPICLVEAEKTAVICAILIPSCIWMATGGLNNFRKESCSVLAGREVILYPDLDAYDKWEAMAPKIAAQIGFEYSISRLLEDSATPDERAQGLDLADYLLKYE